MICITTATRFRLSATQMSIIWPGLDLFIKSDVSRRTKGGIRYAYLRWRTLFTRHLAYAGDSVPIVRISMKSLPVFSSASISRSTSRLVRCFRPLSPSVAFAAAAPCFPVFRVFIILSRVSPVRSGRNPCKQRVGFSDYLQNVPFCREINTAGKECADLVHAVR